MDDLLKHVLPSCGPDQIREARKFLSERKIFSLEDMVKTNEHELKTCKLFNQISVGKIRALLRKGIDLKGINIYELLTGFNLIINALFV